MIEQTRLGSNSGSLPSESSSKLEQQLDEIAARNIVAPTNRDDVINLTGLHWELMELILSRERAAQITLLDEMEPLIIDGIPNALRLWLKVRLAELKDKK